MILLVLRLKAELIARWERAPRGEGGGLARGWVATLSADSIPVSMGCLGNFSVLRIENIRRIRS